MNLWFFWRNFILFFKEGRAILTEVSEIIQIWGIVEDIETGGDFRCLQRESKLICRNRPWNSARNLKKCQLQLQK
jgi:hypothetical protein